MNKKRSLVQVNSAYDLYVCTSLVRDPRNKQKVDLLIPSLLASRLTDEVRASYGKVFTFNPTIRNLMSSSATSETLRLRSWAKKHRSRYNSVLFGAYRSDITSVLARQLYGYTNLLAVKQGQDIPDTRYKDIYSLKNIHDALYFSLFGFSRFNWGRLEQTKVSPEKSDYLFSRPKWRRDPFDRSRDVFTIGVPQQRFDDGTPCLLPNFRNMKRVPGEMFEGDLLIIGERTPMTPSWGDVQDKHLEKIFDAIVGSSKVRRVYVRARKNLTNTAFYSALSPIFLDPDQLYDDQLLKLNPAWVISVKSTASKVAAYYGYKSLLLYPAMEFEDAEVEHLNHLFGDGAPFLRITHIGDLMEGLASEVKLRFDEEFSRKSLDRFFERFND